MIVGIDIAKSKLDIYCMPSNRHVQIKNTLPGIKCFLKELMKKNEIEQVIFESTGGHEKILTICLIEMDIEYHRAHPKRVYHFGQGEGYFAKTDKIDARLLAHYGQLKSPEPTKHETRKTLELKELSSRKAQLKDLIGGEKRRLSQPYLSRIVVRLIKQSIRCLEQQLTTLNEQIKQLIKGDKRLTEKQKLLCSVKGVGSEVSTILIAELPELGRLSREAISCLVGVAPRTRDSGRSQAYRSVSYGRFDVRKSLYMAALVASQHNPRMKAIYRKLLDKGKKKKVALVAIMRKMIIMMNAMIKNNSSWQTEKNLA